MRARRPLLVGSVVLLVGACSAASPSAARPRATPTAAATARDVIAAQAMLDRRSHAMLTRDRAGFDATIAADASAADRQRQTDAFTSSAVLPFRSWNLRIAADAAAPPAHGHWVVLATLSYALAGFDPSPVSLPRVLALTQTPSGWTVAADTQRDAPWDFGRLTVTRGASVLVVAHTGQQGAAALLEKLGDAAVPAVTRAWGTGWSQRVVIILPATLAELEAELVTTDDLSRLAAVQSVELDGSRPSTGDRVLVNPVAFLTKVSPLGQRVILTHEITHVASASVTTPNVPLWLVEGLADTVGFGTTNLTPKQGSPELAASIAKGVVPTKLPANTDFSATSPTLVIAYEQAWLACRLIRDRVGIAGLVALYRAVGGGQSVETALTTTLHTTLAHFVAAWRATLRAELA